MDLDAAPSPYTGLDVSAWPMDEQGWGGRDPELMDAVKMAKPTLAVEVGAWKGQSTRNIARVMKESGVQDPLLLSVDTWMGALEFMIDTAGIKQIPASKLNRMDRFLYPTHGYPHVYYQWLANIVHEGVTDVVLPVPQTSIIGAQFLRLANVAAQLIYVDAAHGAEDVYADMFEYWPVLDKSKELDAIMVGDDITWESVQHGVARFVREFCKGLPKAYQQGNKWWLYRSNCTVPLRALE